MNKDELNNFIKMLKSEQEKKKYNDKIAQKTNYYQQKYKFEKNTRKGHEFWNNESDAFKHAFGSADLALKMGNLGSLAGGISHEWSTKNNPQGEWNMDSWNNNVGREIAREIKKDDIIAVRVMEKMNNGQLITNPNDTRKFHGILENIGNFIKNLLDNKLTAQNVSVSDTNHIFTPSEIGKMTSADFAKSELEIMQQVKNGLIRNKQSSVDYSGYTNPISGSEQIYTQEDIGNMTVDEYAKYEKVINAQLNTIGIPTNGEMKAISMNGGSVIYVHPYLRTDGTPVKGYYRSK